MVSLQFLINIFLRPHNGPGVDSASIRNENQAYLQVGEGGRCVGLTILLPPCADWQEIGRLRASPGLCRNCFTFMHVYEDRDLLI